MSLHDSLQSSLEEERTALDSSLGFLLAGAASRSTEDSVMAMNENTESVTAELRQSRIDGVDTCTLLQSCADVVPSASRPSPLHTAVAPSTPTSASSLERDPPVSQEEVVSVEQMRRATTISDLPSSSGRSASAGSNDGSAFFENSDERSERSYDDDDTYANDDYEEDTSEPGHESVALSSQGPSPSNRE